MEEITPQDVLAAYTQGYFPMAKSREDKTVYWFYPEERGVLPLERFHIPRSLKKRIKEKPFVVTADTDFDAVMRACAEPRDKDGTWINDTILALYGALHREGYAHSMECWDGNALVGGLYGVSLGGVFFGESMFSRQTDASKIALVYLVEILKASGYALLDTQWMTPHLQQFGGMAIARDDYLARLEKALYIVPNPSSRFSTVAGKVLSASFGP